MFGRSPIRPLTSRPGRYLLTGTADCSASLPAIAATGINSDHDSKTYGSSGTKDVAAAVAVTRSAVCFGFASNPLDYRVLRKEEIVMTVVLG